MMHSKHKIIFGCLIMLFDYMLKTVNEPLSKEMMIQMNMILKEII